MKRYPRGIMATACIPWTEDYCFDEQMFRQEVDLLCDNGLKNIYLYGTAGEGYSVSNTQYLEIVKAFYEETRCRQGVRPMVGVISLSPDEILRRIDCAAAAGIRDFQISFPAWGQVGDSEALTFLHYICDRFPELSFMHYNNGLRSRKKLGGKDYERICREIPNLVAVKHTAATVYEILDLMERDLPLQIFFLEEAYGYASLTGEASLLISLGNINYRRTQEYYQAGVEQDAGKVIRLAREFHRCLELVGRLPAGKMDGAYDKLFVKFSLPDFPQRLYPPYEGISDEEYEIFRAEVAAALPHWLEEI